MHATFSLKGKLNNWFAHWRKCWAMLSAPIGWLGCETYYVNNAWNAATGSTPSVNQIESWSTPQQSRIIRGALSVLMGTKSFEEKVNEASAHTRKCMPAVAERMKRRTDGKRREHEVWDQVLLSIWSCSWCCQVQAEFCRTFRSEHAELHSWFHVSLLRSFCNGGRVDSALPPIVAVDDEIGHFIKEIISRRVLANDSPKHLV